MKTTDKLFARKKYTHTESQLFFDFAVDIDLIAIEDDAIREIARTNEAKCDIDLSFDCEYTYGDSL